ncbi:hypothetical protein LSTR_LSTR008423 [Laodelphax striatellus]|uniref:Uncharacterized protein n=1 Tax=Laodelphax striatellus TaxID=195883 RepID=A0A482XV77_LAOST|nr:hypothetical protein LSTR_LSTR008423 [Laodelphax striatellus]
MKQNNSPRTPPPPPPPHHFCRRRPNNIWRHQECRALANQTDCSFPATKIENKTSRFNLKMQQGDKLKAKNKASHINWLMQRHRLLSLPPTVRLLGLSLPKPATAQSILDY